MHHNSFEGCQKCNTTGKRYLGSNRTSFPRINCEKRTDHAFRHRLVPNHHREYSIIEELPIDLVDDFVTSDSLHLFHLGIMKKCLDIWKNGSKYFKYKWTDDNIAELNRLFHRCNSEMPTDIHRSVRSLNLFKFWKGTEFRSLLNYIGIVVLKPVLRKEEYEHFRKLFCAVTLCSNDKYLKYVDIAENLFHQYIEEFIDLYGIDSISSNVHNLAHVVSDVRRFGNLNRIDSYQFENCLYGLKLRLRKCNKPLEQISRRITELNLDYRHPVDTATILYEQHVPPDMKYPIQNMETNETVYQQISLGSDSLLSCRKFGDKWFMTINNFIVEFHHAVSHNDKYFLYGRRVKYLKNYFTFPFSSELINIYCGKQEYFAPHYYPLESVKCKMLCLTHENIELIFVPLLHTLH